jgi:hypothetical protein
MGNRRSWTVLGAVGQDVWRIKVGGFGGLVRMRGVERNRYRLGKLSKESRVTQSHSLESSVKN